MLAQPCRLLVAQGAQAVIAVFGFGAGVGLAVADQKNVTHARVMARNRRAGNDLSDVSTLSTFVDLAAGALVLVVLSFVILAYPICS